MFRLLLIAVTLHQVTAFANNLTIAGDDSSLWATLAHKCEKPTLACLETNVMGFLGRTLDSDDVQVSDFLTFTKNRLDYAAPTSNATLQDKSVRFFMTHDMELHLPDTIGGTLKVSPRSMEEAGGALMKIEFLRNDVEEGRLFFKKIKGFKKFISQRLVWALLAILLVIKLLAAKFLFFLPSMVGAVAAKKLLIKVVLFLFPALHHIFKFCPYVPHGTKYHHHKHQIAHVHHVPHGHHGPPPHHHHKVGPPHHSSIEVIAPHSHGPPPLLKGGTPSLHHFSDVRHESKPLFTYDDQELDYFHGGPALSHQFINHRQDESAAEEQSSNEVQAAWGQGQETKKKTISQRPFTVPEIENMILKAEKEHMLKTRLQKERLKIHEENARLQEQLKQALRIQDKLRQQTAKVVQKTYTTATPATPYQYQKPSTTTTPAPVYYAPKSSQTEAAPPAAKRHSFEEALHQAATITYDPFYSPILEKIDHILNGLGFKEEPCRERLICSMYKNPAKFSPHSNLLSAELSRDSNELQKPKTTNAAVIRFYRYVQAARDGQDKRECLRLYPTCSINTEQK